MSWKTTTEIRREGGKLHVLSVLPNLFRYKRIEEEPKPEYDPDQFSWCQGEECARDWQDPPLVRGRKP